MSFYKYPHLPKEIRLQIIEESIDLFTLQDSHHDSDICLYPFAAIDLEWNQVIERRVFKTIQLHPEDLDNFSNICSKRHGMLSKVRLVLNVNDVPVESTPSEQQRVMGVLAQLFEIMKHWTPDAERGQQGLIGLELRFFVPLRSTFSPIPQDIEDFPEVPIIGAFSEELRPGCCFQLHQPALNTLHTKLPNLCRTRLPLQLGPPLQSATELASSAVEQLHATNPNLIDLDIVADGNADDRLLGQSNWITVTECLAPLISRWHDSLVCLTLKHPVHVAHFLLKAGNVTWPKLKQLTLSGRLDEPQNGSDEVSARINHGCDDLLEGLVSASRSMPEMNKIRICLRDVGPLYSGFTLSMDFGRLFNSTGHIAVIDFFNSDQPAKGPLKLCSDRLVPLSASVVAVVENTTISQQPIELHGNLVTELQETVRRYRQLELAFFSCSGKYHSWGCENDYPCTQWNAQTGMWDPAFWNDMDVFMYQMGKYWEWKTNVEGYEW